MSLVYRLSSL